MAKHILVCFFMPHSVVHWTVVICLLENISGRRREDSKQSSEVRPDTEALCCNRVSRSQRRRDELRAGQLLVDCADDHHGCCSCGQRDGHPRSVRWPSDCCHRNQVTHIAAWSVSIYGSSIKDVCIIIGKNLSSLPLSTFVHIGQSSGTEDIGSDSQNGICIRHLLMICPTVRCVVTVYKHHCQTKNTVYGYRPLCLWSLIMLCCGSMLTLKPYFPAHFCPLSSFCLMPSLFMWMSFMVDLSRQLCIMLSVPRPCSVIW